MLTVRLPQCFFRFVWPSRVECALVDSLVRCGRLRSGYMISLTRNSWCGTEANSFSYPPIESSERGGPSSARARGWGVFPALALANHSCWPTAVRWDEAGSTGTTASLMQPPPHVDGRDPCVAAAQDGGMWFRALGRLRQGTEVTQCCESCAESDRLLLLPTHARLTLQSGDCVSDCPQTSRWAGRCCGRTRGDWMVITARWSQRSERSRTRTILCRERTSCHRRTASTVAAHAAWPSGLRVPTETRLQL